MYDSPLAPFAFDSIVCDTTLFRARTHERRHEFPFAHFLPPPVIVFFRHSRVGFFAKIPKFHQTLHLFVTVRLIESVHRSGIKRYAHRGKSRRFRTILHIYYSPFLSASVRNDLFTLSIQRDTMLNPGVFTRRIKSVKFGSSPAFHTDDSA